jgi:hypothetical protein
MNAISTEEHLMLDNWTFVVIMRLHRPYFVATEGYIMSEERFADDPHDPYFAVAYDADKEEHIKLVRQSSLRRGLEVIYKFANGYDLTTGQQKYLENGYMLAEGSNDFAMEIIFPLASYIYVERSIANNDYMTNYHACTNELELLLLKYFTQFELIYDSLEFNDFGLCVHLGLEAQGYTFRQLQVMLGFESERTARGLALESTPVEKRIRVIKLPADETKGRIKRTLIAESEFKRYIQNYNKTRTIEKEGNTMSVQIKLTGGNIRNSHVYLTKVMEMFPSHFIGGSRKELMAQKQLKLDVGNGKVFDTDIAGDKKIFRSREALKTFFENYDVTEGDSISLSTSDQYEYKLRPLEQ